MSEKVNISYFMKLTFSLTALLCSACKVHLGFFVLTFLPLWHFMITQFRTFRIHKISEDVEWLCSVCSEFTWTWVAHHSVLAWIVTIICRSMLIWKIFLLYRFICLVCCVARSRLAFRLYHLFPVVLAVMVEVALVWSFPR